MQQFTICIISILINVNMLLATRVASPAGEASARFIASTSAEAMLIWVQCTFYAQDQEVYVRR